MKQQPPRLVPGMIVVFRRRGWTWWSHRQKGMVEQVEPDRIHAIVQLIDGSLGRYEFTGKRRRVSASNVEVVPE